MQEETLIDYMLRLFEAKLFPIKHYVSFWHARGGSRKPRMNETTDKETR